MNVIRILASSIVGIVFLVAGAAKLADRARWSVEARELGAPSVVVPFVPYGEIVIGAMLVAQVSPRLFGAIAFGLLAVFTVLIARVLSSGRRPACACFGAWSARPIGAGNIGRNVVLMALCILAMF